MAFDNSLLNETEPSNSAVDRLKKRGRRIKPWESSLIEEPIGVPLCDDGPLGELPRGPSPSEVERPMGSAITGSESPRSPRPLGNLPTGAVTQRGHSPVGLLPTGGSLPVNYPEVHLPTGVDDQKAAPPLGDTPNRPDATTGDSPAGGRSKNADPVGQLPTGLDQCDRHPVGNTPTGLSNHSLSHPEGLLRVGDSPSGQKSPRAFNPEGSTPSDSAQDGTKLLNDFLPTHRMGCDWKEAGNGELHIPHKLLEFAIKATSTRNELALLLFFIRYTLGFRRPECKAGYSFLTDWTGINDVTNLRKGLKALLASGLIVKIKAHDSIANSGAVYEVPIVQQFLSGGVPGTKPPGGGGNRRSLPARSEDAPTGSVTQSANNPLAGGANTHSPVGVLPTKKENKKENLNKTPAEFFLDDLIRQVERTRPLKKRENERESLSALISTYLPQQIQQALDYVKRNGTLEGQRFCHTPFTYLCQKMEGVLSRTGYKDGLNYESRLAEISEANTEKSNRSDREQAIDAFETELLEQQRTQFISQYTQTEYPHGFLPPTDIIRNLAAQSWFKNHSGAEIQAAV
jgi:hypothetical protein